MATDLYVFKYGEDSVRDALARSDVIWSLSDDLRSASAPSLLSFEATPLLRGVDPYDDTTFNQRQCERLRDEVQHLRSLELDAAQTLVIDDLDRLLDVVRQGPPHTYLRFNGD